LREKDSKTPTAEEKQRKVTKQRTQKRDDIGEERGKGKNDF
jgi:hypothetical protein